MLYSTRAGQPDKNSCCWRFSVTRYRPIAVLLAALAGVAVLAGCGSDKESVPANSVAVVGDQTITKSEFDQLIDQAQGSYKTQKREFPKPGTQEYQALRGQAMQFLVQRAQFEQKADDLGIKVTDKDVDARLKQLIKQYFGGSQKKYEKQLKQQGLSEDQVRQDVRAQLIQERIYNEVTKDVKVDDAAIEASYKKNKSQYVQPATRQVRHILVKKKKLADQLYDQLRHGGNFARLAKKYSQDPSSKTQGGKLTVSKGQTVPPFDRVAFSQVTNGISKPVKTQYGWHIIQPLGPVKKQKTTPLPQVKDAIRQQLLQERKQKKMNDWVADIRKDFEKQTTYQVGYAPPETTSTQTQTQ
jgi:parvulin-like peptidyl-prolyl isomerase